MGAISIAQKSSQEQDGESRDLEWEEECYQQGCVLARQEAIKRLQEMEEKLFCYRPCSWRVEGFRERTLVTRFGEITIRRRLYRDEKEGYHFLLDEYLSWLPDQAATPSLQDSVVTLATQVPFREASNTLEKLTAGALSTTSIHRLLQRTAQAAMKKEKQEWQAGFEQGRDPPSKNQKASVLYMEADGVWVHLQREKKSHYEVKSAIAYEGWERLPQREERYALKNKRVYCHADEEIPFWEGASIEWSRIWDLSRVELVVIGGDGAGWIDEGLEWFPGAIRQLDGFHLARACCRGWEGGETIYRAIRKGERTEGLTAKAPIQTGGQAEKARRYVGRNIEKGIDWRAQVKAPEEGRGLGAMESNEDKLIANRMKKRGMSWTIKGAQRMAKVLQLKANGEIRLWCGRQQPLTEGEGVSQPMPRGFSRDGYGEWLQVRMPALTGPHASRPWVEKLRALAYDSHRLN